MILINLQYNSKISNKILMLNYHKTYRESLDKSKKRPTPRKEQIINIGHTSSINLKLSSEFQPMKVSLKSSKQNCDPLRKQIPQAFRKQLLSSHSKSRSNLKADMPSGQKKYSFKIKPRDPHQQLNKSKLKTHYDQYMKPFQQTNRCMITDRNNSKGLEYRIDQNRNGLQLRTEHRDTYEEKQQRTFYQYEQVHHEVSMKKDVSTKHNTESLNGNQASTVKVSVIQLKKLYQQFKQYQNQVSLLQKQLVFYKKSASKHSKNSVLRALAD